MFVGVEVGLATRGPAGRSHAHRLVCVRFGDDLVIRVALSLSFSFAFTGAIAAVPVMPLLLKPQTCVGTVVYAKFNFVGLVERDLSGED